MLVENVRKTSSEMFKSLGISGILCAGSEEAVPAVLSLSPHVLLGSDAHLISACMYVLRLGHPGRCTVCHIGPPGNPESCRRTGEDEVATDQ